MAANPAGWASGTRRRIASAIAASSARSAKSDSSPITRASGNAPARSPMASAVALLGLAGCATARGERIPEISQSAMEQAVRVLASDAFEGREPGTPAEDKTLAYVTGQFAAAGLQPGNNGSWLQDVPLVEIT